MPYYDRDSKMDHKFDNHPYGPPHRVLLLGSEFASFVPRMILVSETFLDPLKDPKKGWVHIGGLHFLDPLGGLG